jgi:hypothetical protein
MYLKLLATSLLAIYSSVAFPQRHEILSDEIRSLVVTANDDWQSLPVVELNNGKIDISFDDMTHDYRRYTYTVEHCQADWSPSEQLFESDYCEGFARDNVIEDIQQSLLTNTLYTHYHLSLPNSNCRLKLSGNYKLTVCDSDDDNRPVLTACFMVVENLMGVMLGVTTDTDIDVNNSHQQVAMELSYAGINVSDPSEQIKTVVMQNGRWDNARHNARPQYVMPDGLRWEHNRSYIFDAGNVYRKFEILSTDVASMGVEKIGWDGTDYHAYTFTSLPRPNYLYDESGQGAFLLRNSDNSESTYTSDYMLVHFAMKCPRVADRDVYLNGNWTYDRLLPQYKLDYNETAQQYEAVVPLKLGYYSYQYVEVDARGNVRPLVYEGNYFQTRNSYQALVYYREPGGRTDLLVGYADTGKQ